MLKQKLTAFFVLPLFSLIIGCGDNPSDSGGSGRDNNLVGEWEMTETVSGGVSTPLSGTTLIIRDDGTYEKVQDFAGTVIESGTWRTDGGKIYFDVQNAAELPNTYEIAGSELILTDLTGITSTHYNKVGGSGGDNGEDASDLVGEWALTKDGAEFSLTLSSNGSYELGIAAELEGDMLPLYGETGTYELSGNQLTTTPESCSSLGFDTQCEGPQTATVSDDGITLQYEDEPFTLTKQ